MHKGDHFDPLEHVNVVQRQLSAAQAILFDWQADIRDSCFHLACGWMALVQVHALKDNTLVPKEEELLTYLEKHFWPELKGPRLRRRRADITAVLSLAAQKADALPTAEQASPSRRLLHSQHQLLDRHLISFKGGLRKTGFLSWNFGQQALVALLLALNLTLIVWIALQVKESSDHQGQLRSSSRSSKGWIARYYPNSSFAGRPITRHEDVISYHWQLRAPHKDFPADNFSVRWDSCLILSGETVAHFELGSDDGSRLFVDGRLVIDNWGIHPFRSAAKRASLKPGRHHLRLDYFELRDKASIRLNAAFDQLGAKLARPADVDQKDPCANLSRN